MSSQTTWFIEERVINVSIESILRGYAADQLLQSIQSLMTNCKNQRRRLHVMVDVSKMQISETNAELLYNALKPLMFDQQIRWIVFYGVNEELRAIFKDVMFDLFCNPCVVLNSHETAVDFLYRKDSRLPSLVQQAS